MAAPQVVSVRCQSCANAWTTKAANPFRNQPKTGRGRPSSGEGAMARPRLDQLAFQVKLKFATCGCLACSWFVRACVRHSLVAQAPGQHLKTARPVRNHAGRAAETGRGPGQVLVGLCCGLGASQLYSFVFYLTRRLRIKLQLRRIVCLLLALLLL